ncbi:MAG: hypothetical protein K0U41_04670 [Gammaproteobacteria bacterium]|nr:hypothetical protein [Gammaproteobacteria bacterium]
MPKSTHKREHKEGLNVGDSQVNLTIYAAACLSKQEHQPSRFIRLGGAIAVLLLSIAVLSACTNDLYTNSIQGLETLAAPGDNNTGSIGDGDNNNTNGGGGDNNNTNGGGGDNNNTNGGGGGNMPPEPDYDIDRDGFHDDEDIDDDGDGLIEISTSAEFNYMRLDLTGRSFLGITQGCGGGLPQSATSCYGFELTNDIDLGAFASWPPMGSCRAKEDCPVNMAFSAGFDGNNHVIRNVNLFPQNTVNGLGLFGSVANTHIRNVIIERAFINPIAHSYDIGVIAVIDNSLIENVHVRDLRIDTVTPLQTHVGGLAARITNSNVVDASVSGYIYVNYPGDSSYVGDYLGNKIGGLVGGCLNTVIRGSAVQLNSLFANANNVGGLAGYCYNAQILGSSSHVGVVRLPYYFDLEALWNIGGLIGHLDGISRVDGSYSHVHRIEMAYSTYSYVGGLIGRVQSVIDVANSYALTNSIMKDPNVYNSNIAGGLFGWLTPPYDTTTSYWDDRAQFIGIRTVEREQNIGRRNSLELRSPTNFTSSGIYGNWGYLWCNPTTFDIITAANPPDGYIRLWDLGTMNEYPALTCSPFSLAEQRTATNNILTGSSPVP